MDKLATSPIAQAVIPLAAGVASAASAPIARGVHGATSAAYLGSKVAGESMERQRLAEFNKFAGTVDPENMMAAMPRLMELAPNPAVGMGLASLIPSMEAQNRPTTMQTPYGIFRIPQRGRGEPERIVDFGKEETKRFKEHKEVEFDYDMKKMSQSFTNAKALHQLDDEIKKTYKDWEAGRPLDPREAIALDSKVEHEYREALIGIRMMNLQIPQEKQAIEDLTKWKTLKKSELKPIMRPILPSSKDPLGYR